MPAQQPDAHTIDMVVAIIAVGALLIGVLSVLWGKAEKLWDWLRGVNTSQIVISPLDRAETRTARTDEADGPSVSAVDPWLARIHVDRTKGTLIDLLVYSGWTTAEIRSVLKGENAAIGTEVEAARQRLGIDPPERVLKVRDAQGERVIPFSR